MGKAVGEASDWLRVVPLSQGRTFKQISTCIPDTCWTSLLVKSSLTHKISQSPPSEALESGLPMAVFATTRYLFTHGSKKKEKAGWEGVSEKPWTCVRRSGYAQAGRYLFGENTRLE